MFSCIASSTLSDAVPGYGDSHQSDPSCCKSQSQYSTRIPQDSSIAQPNEEACNLAGEGVESAEYQQRAKEGIPNHGSLFPVSISTEAKGENVEEETSIRKRVSKMLLYSEDCADLHLRSNTQKAAKKSPAVQAR